MPTCQVLDVPVGVPHPKGGHGEGAIVLGQLFVLPIQLKEERVNNTGLQ